MAKGCIFVLGGARSGKSHFAQELAAKLGSRVLFVATGEALDEEMLYRISQHKKLRPQSWRTLEVSKEVGKKIMEHIGDAEVVVIDCLTLLVSNVVTEGELWREPARAEEEMLAEISEIIDCMDKLAVSFIVVSNEVGMGLVPENELGRLYRDLLGRGNQLIAQRAGEVYLLAAGVPVKIKEKGSVTES